MKKKVVVVSLVCLFVLGLFSLYAASHFNYWNSDGCVGGNMTCPVVNPK